MNTVNNCPHCGAAITTEKCPYCGTLFYDFATIDTEQPFYIKIKRGNMLYRAKVKLNNVNVNADYDDSVSYYDNCPVMTMQKVTRTITTTFEVIEDEKNILGIAVDLDEIKPDVKAW